MSNKEQFLTALKETNRVTDQLLQFLESSDFFEAPASTAYHGNYPGGLAEHCINVTQSLIFLNEHLHAGYDVNCLIIVGLLHDLCKANFYAVSTRNVKNEATGQWEKKPYYKRQEQYHFGGHGSKSVYLVQSLGIQLTAEEAAAINAHMGAWDRSDYSNPGDVYENNKLAWLLHVADEYAAYFIDGKEN